MGDAGTHWKSGVRARGTGVKCVRLGVVFMRQATASKGGKTPGRGITWGSELQTHNTCVHMKQVGILTQLYTTSTHPKPPLSQPTNQPAKTLQGAEDPGIHTCHTNNMCDKQQSRSSTSKFSACANGVCCVGCCQTNLSHTAKHHGRNHDCPTVLGLRVYVRVYGL